MKVMQYRQYKLSGAY